MTTSLKSIYSSDYVERLGGTLSKLAPFISPADFRSAVYQEDWEQLEFKQRVTRIAEAMHHVLPDEYLEALEILDQAAPSFQGLEGLAFPEFAARFGQEHRERSLQALETYTRYSTSEFAIRSFLKNDLTGTLAQMAVWTKSPNEHVRRLASEGSRPRLPWGAGVPALKTDPELTLPLLEELALDASLYVQKSVANHLNDISKTHPDLFIETVTRWNDTGGRTSWIVKHASRSLLKKGDPRILGLFGFYPGSTEVSELMIAPLTPAIGDSAEFSFLVSATAHTKIRVEFAVDYVKSSGRRSRKVFHVTETQMPADTQRPFIKTLSFRQLTTRVHYPGRHTLAILINGEEKQAVDFELTDREKEPLP
ncbi:DNA alkylation repair protein [Sinobaca sp. H24]|uniref:DNA alkylation repair protein n=1 Tax=Sinobaca sp. H24 TaxID=2923376 RepID=UPI00207AA5FC|nr:DNA alkylation repair protein [Sinobaca sp. H24]